PSLAAKKRLLVGTKLDLPEAAERMDAFRSAFPGERVHGISVFSGQGIDDLREAFFEMASEHEAAADADEASDEDFFPLGDSESDEDGA
ncbi:MAG: GTPase ObgE, partial [Spirochaetaceae bacterium]|nr:GTPase ObgE [Spirochaetaceae bacterium]